MAWLEDRVWCHPKFTDLSSEAGWVWTRAIAYSSGMATGGTLTAGQLRILGATTAVVDELVEARLWVRATCAPSAILIYNWDEYNGLRDERRERERERKRLSKANWPSRRARGAQLARTSRALRARVDGSEGSDGSRKKQELTNQELSPRYAAAFSTLAQIEKIGYGDAKFTAARFTVLADKHPAADLIAEAEALRDWETYGAGEKKDTRDGIARFSRWLANSNRPALYAVPAEQESDYPWMTGVALP